jgi:hypothetical protein
VTLVFDVVCTGRCIEINYVTATRFYIAEGYRDVKWIGDDRETSDRGLFN